MCIRDRYKDFLTTGNNVFLDLNIFVFQAGYPLLRPGTGPGSEPVINSSLRRVVDISTYKNIK